MPRKKNGKPNKSKWYPHIDAMVAMANNGASYTEIGEAFGAPASAIRNALTRRGKYVTRRDVARVNKRQLFNAVDANHVLRRQNENLLEALKEALLIASPDKHPIKYRFAKNIFDQATGGE